MNYETCLIDWKGENKIKKVRWYCLNKFYEIDHMKISKKKKEIMQNVYLDVMYSVIDPILKGKKTRIRKWPSYINDDECV